MNSRFDVEVNNVLKGLFEAAIDDIVADTEKPSMLSKFKDSALNKIKSGIKGAAKAVGSAAITAATGGYIDPFTAHDYLNKKTGTSTDNAPTPQTNQTPVPGATPQTTKPNQPNQPNKTGKISDSNQMLNTTINNLKQLSPSLNTRDSSIIIDRFVKKLRTVTIPELTQATNNLQILTPPTQIDDKYIDSCFSRLAGPNGKQPVDKGGLGPLSDQAAIKSYSDMLKHFIKVAPALKNPKKMQAFFVQNGLLS